MGMPARDGPAPRKSLTLLLRRKSFQRMLSLPLPRAPCGFSLAERRCTLNVLRLEPRNNNNQSGEHMPAINWLAVIVAAVAAFGVGAIWYSPMLFTKAWI